ncbi:MAG: glycosyltransferase [Verrucomicrobiota bacterium]
MHHLHFVQSLEPSTGAGLGYSALGMHNGLNEAGERSELCTTRASEFSRKWDGTRQYERKGPAKVFYAPDLGRDAEQLVEAADVVHGHGFYVYPNWVMGREARRVDKPMVYHVQGFLDPWILARSRGKKRLAGLLFENANFRHVSLWRACSDKENQQIRDYGITAPIVTLPNGVHLPPERSSEEVEKLVGRFPRKRPRRVVFLSRIHKKKGLDLLLPAWAGLPKGLTADWEIALFGPDEGGYQATIEGIAKELDLGEVVSFYGSVSGEDKEAALRSADLFVLPSYSEGFPMAVLEAASYGLPVVQTDECNFPALTERGGAWEATPTIESVQEQLGHALSTDELERRQRGELGRQLVSEQYSWSSIATRLVEACQKYL